MFAHIVLLTPRRDLPEEDRRAFVAAFEKAMRSIPSVRGVRMGERVRLGTGYEASAPIAPAYLALIEFDDVDGIREYLAHPAHDALSFHFHHSLSLAAAFDFEIGGLDVLEKI
jgi:hypothetical protein